MRQLVALALLLTVAVAAGAPVAAAEPVLPDLYQETPYELGVEGFRTADGGTAWHLGFGSTVYNFGRGPLQVEGRRASTADPEMVATQVVHDRDGSTTERPGIGRLRYVDAITHRHWHYLRFNTYALRGVTGGLARPDQKTGFCLGDRVVGHDWERLPGQPSRPVFDGGCGYDSPELLTVSEGISPNYGDPYPAQVEGQFIDISGVPSGRYQLVHHVNADRSLREADYSNNVASVLLSIEWPDGPGAQPRVAELARCPLSARCPVAPELTARRAVGLARQALRRYGVRGSGVRCAPPARGAAVCRATVSRRTASVRIRYGVARGEVFWSWSVRGRGLRTRSGRVTVPQGRGTPVPVTAAGASGKVAYCPLVAAG